MWKIHSVIQPASSLCMPTYAVSPDLNFGHELGGWLVGKTHICLSSSTIVLPVCFVKRPFCCSTIGGSETTKAVSSLSLCGRDKVRSKLEKAMPCFFGFRTRAMSGREEASASSFMTLADVAWSGGVEVAIFGSSSLVSLPGLLRKTLRRLFARKVGPSAVSSILMCYVQTVIVISSVR